MVYNKKATLFSLSSIFQKFYSFMKMTVGGFGLLSCKLFKVIQHISDKKFLNRL